MGPVVNRVEVLQPLKQFDPVCASPNGELAKARPGDHMCGEALCDSWKEIHLGTPVELCNVQLFESLYIPEKKVAPAKKWMGVLFLDLDGTVRKGKEELGRFVNGPEDVQVFEGMKEALTLYKDYGYYLVAVTNQGGVATGYMSMDALSKNLAETDKQVGDVFDLIMSDTTFPVKGMGPRESQSFGRKPSPGMIFDALYALQRDHQDESFSPYDCLMVGDRHEDGGAAQRAGIAFAPTSVWRAAIRNSGPFQVALAMRERSRGIPGYSHDGHAFEGGTTLTSTR